MNQSSIENRTLALAGVFQAAALVKTLAKASKADEKFFIPSIESLFKIEANSVLDIYTHPQHLALGLNELIHLFTHNKQPKDPEIARYVFSLLHLEKKLSKNAEMLNIIRTGIKRAKTQAAHFSTTHENVMANLASLYTDTLSTFTFRVYVSGEPAYLNQPYLLNKIRALLLAGVRSAVLWQQLGGKRWQLLISRASLLAAAKEWLKTPMLETTPD
jgi:high frequency lysogenization protein